MPDGSSHWRPGRFATTRWSLVLAAGRPGHERSAEALASLCETYWYPVYAFIRRRGVRVEDCADLTQAFFAQVLEKNYFHEVDPARGRFRAFLCASLRNFLANEWDRAHALKRGGSQPPLSLDLRDAEGRYQREPADALTPERLFDRRWALLLLDRVLTRLRDDYTSSNRAALFECLKGYLTGASAEVPYAGMAERLGMSEGAVKVAVHRLRRHFRDRLIEEIADTVSDPDDIDGEIAHLLAAVSS